MYRHARFGRAPDDIFCSAAAWKRHDQIGLAFVEHPLIAQWASFFAEFVPFALRETIRLARDAPARRPSISYPVSARARFRGVVRDHDGQQLAYVYFENEPGRCSAAKLLSKAYVAAAASSRAYRTREEFAPRCSESCHALQRNNGRWCDLCRKSY